MKFEKSPIQDSAEKHLSLDSVLLKFGVKNIKELYSKFMKVDQDLMKNLAWDYEDKNQETNSIKEALESVEVSELNPNQEEWRNAVLYLWYHHAISAAIRKGEKEKAQKFAKEALGYKAENHPGKITELLNFLIHDNLEEAKNWYEKIEDEIEKETAKEIIEIYESDKWPLNKD